MNTTEFTLWLNGYLEALESEGIKTMVIENIRKKMSEIKTNPNQERIVFGPNVNPPPRTQYGTPPTNKDV